MSDPKKIETTRQALYAILQGVILIQRIMGQSHKKPEQGGIAIGQPSNPPAHLNEDEWVIQRDPKNHV
jgi:hypothetical protein